MGGLNFYGFSDQNPSPHTCPLSTLATESFPHPDFLKCRVGAVMLASDCLARCGQPNNLYLCLKLLSWDSCCEVIRHPYWPPNSFCAGLHWIHVPCPVLTAHTDQTFHKFTCKPWTSSQDKTLRTCCALKGDVSILEALTGEAHKRPSGTIGRKTVPACLGLLCCGGQGTEIPTQDQIGRG